MAFHNVPPNGFPDIPDIEDLEAVQGDVSVLKSDVSELKSGLTNLDDNFTDVIGWNHRKNLFDKNATNTSNGFVPNTGLGSDNSTSATNDYNVSEYIPVTAGVTYTLQGLVGNQAAICFYNSEKTYIIGYIYQNQSEKTITAPPNSAYARFTVNKANIDITQMEVGSTATQYEPYHPVIGTTVEGLQSDLTSLQNVVDGDYHAIQGSSSVDIPITGGVYRFITSRDSNRFLTCGLITYNWNGTPDVAMLYASSDTLITVTASSGKVTFANAAQSSYCNLVLYKIF